MIKHLFMAMLVLTFVGVAQVPAAQAETADSLLANKKQRNAPLLPPTSSLAPQRFKAWAQQKDLRATRGW